VSQITRRGDGVAMDWYSSEHRQTRRRRRVHRQL